MYVIKWACHDVTLIYTGSFGDSGFLGHIDNGFEKENSSSATDKIPQVIVDCSKGERYAQENEETADESETRPEPILRRSQRETRKPDYYGEWANSATMISEPNTVTEALKCPERKYWKEAMTAEIQSLHDLIPPPKDCKVVGSKWVSKGKLGDNRLVERFKARVVAQGYSQRAGIVQYYRSEDMIADMMTDKATLRRTI